MSPANKKNGGLAGQKSEAREIILGDNRSFGKQGGRRAKRVGATAIEYALVLSLLSVFVIIGVQQFGEATMALFTNSATQLEFLGSGQSGDAGGDENNNDEDD